jgi:hypothetical protein
MKTMISLFPILFLFNLQVSFAQECQKQTDPFTNEPIVSFEWKAGGIRTLFFESINGKSTVELRAGEIGGVEAVIPKGSEVLFKLDNGEVIKLTTLLDSKSAIISTTIDTDNNVTSSVYFLKMSISTDQLKQFAKAKVSSIKLPDLHGGFQIYGTKELRNRFERFLFEGAKCLTDGL